jgi:hypothetical protein
MIPIIKRQAWRFTMIEQQAMDRGTFIKFY